MGYFDGLASAKFKTAQDGSRLFFPWGIWGRGYTIASEQEYERLRKHIKIYFAVSLVLIVTLGQVLSYSYSFALAAVFIGFYSVWMSYLLRQLKKSDERLSLNESMTSQARAFNVMFLWFGVVASIGFVGCGIFILIIEPTRWMLAVSAILLFGMTAAKSARMLMLRRHATMTVPLE